MLRCVSFADVGYCCSWFDCSLFMRSGASRDALLRSSCEKYEALVRLDAGSYAVHYNWGVALRCAAPLNKNNKHAYGVN